MLEYPKFDPQKDVEPVMENGAFDLNEALLTGQVTDTGENLDYNGIEDPSLITGRVEDVFQAIDEHRRINRHFSQKNNNPTPSPSSGEN